MKIEQPVACRDFSSFDFHPAPAGMLGATLIRDQVVQMGQSHQKRRLAPFGGNVLLGLKSRSFEEPASSIEGIMQPGTTGLRYIQAHYTDIPCTIYPARTGGDTVGIAVQASTHRLTATIYKTRYIERKPLCHGTGP